MIISHIYVQLYLKMDFTTIISFDSRLEEANKRFPYVIAKGGLQQGTSCAEGYTYVEGQGTDHLIMWRFPREATLRRTISNITVLCASARKDLRPCPSTSPFANVRTPGYQHKGQAPLSPQAHHGVRLDTVTSHQRCRIFPFVISVFDLDFKQSLFKWPWLVMTIYLCRHRGSRKYCSTSLLSRKE